MLLQALHPLFNTFTVKFDICLNDGFVLVWSDVLSAMLLTVQALSASILKVLQLNNRLTVRYSHDVILEHVCMKLCVLLSIFLYYSDT